MLRFPVTVAKAIALCGCRALPYMIPVASAALLIWPFRVTETRSWRLWVMPVCLPLRTLEAYFGGLRRSSISSKEEEGDHWPESRNSPVARFSARRDAAVAGAAGLAGCAAGAKSDAGADAQARPRAAGRFGQQQRRCANLPEFVPSFMNPPAPVDESEGNQRPSRRWCAWWASAWRGVVRCARPRSRARRPFGFDKGSDVGYRSGEFGTFGSEIHKQLGIEQPGTQEVVNELMKVMGNRPQCAAAELLDRELRPGLGLVHQHQPSTSC